jgi:hypothetical protein
MRNGVVSNPDAHNTWNVVLRSLSRSQATGLRKQVLSDFKFINLQTRSGIYLGKRIGYEVDTNRIRSVVQRIVRGLYFIESGNPLGLENDVRVFDEEDLQGQSSEFLQQLKQNILNPLSNLKPKIIGNNVFLYRFYIIKEKPLFSVWGMAFYGRVPYLTITASPHSIEDKLG